MCILLHSGGPFSAHFPLGSLANLKHSGNEICKQKKDKMSPHMVEIIFCCVASFPPFFFLPPPPFPSDVFIAKPNVCLDATKNSQERENP